MALLSLAVYPSTPEDAQRLTAALQQVVAQDPTVDVQSRPGDADIVIGCDTEEHLERIVDRLAKDFHVTASLGRVQVEYRGALMRPALGESKYVASKVGQGEYAHVKIRVCPVPPGTGPIVIDEIRGGEIPGRFSPSAIEGIRDRLARGVVGHRIDDVRIELYDGSYHEVDSTERAFRTAGFLAADEAVRNGDPVLLEPLMRVEAVVPDAYAADVYQNLVGRGAQIQSVEDSGATRVIRALAPLTQLFGYAADVSSRTRGTGTCTMKFERYVAVIARGGDGGESFVGARLKPTPKPRDRGAALPEPDEDATES